MEPSPPKEFATCLLCSQTILITEYERHMALHEQAEMLADILALSRQ